MLSTLQSLLLVAVSVWGQCCSANDRGPQAYRLQDKTFVQVLHSTTKIIKIKAEHINTLPDFTPPPALPTGNGSPTFQHGFTTFPIFSTEAYEVEECQFDNDDPGFSKCHTSTTTVTYVNGISTSYFDDTPTDSWSPPFPPFTTPTWDPTSVIPLPTILPTTPTPHYPQPPSSFAPPWETSLDLCDVFSATWCQSTSRTDSNSYSHSYSHSHHSTFTTIFDSCSTSSRWWCLPSTTTTPPTPFTSTHNATTLTLQPTSVCVSHNLTSTCFTKAPPRPTNTTLLPHTTAISSSRWWNTSTIVWPTNGTATIPVNLTSLIAPPQVTGLPPFLNSTAPVPAATPLLSSLVRTSSDIPTTQSETKQSPSPLLSISTLLGAGQSSTDTPAFSSSSSSSATLEQVQHPKHSLSKHESSPTWFPATQKPARTTSTLDRGHADGDQGDASMPDT